MNIRVLLNANDRSKTDFSDEPLFWRKSPNWPPIVHFYWRKLYICTIFSGYHQDGEQIIFMDIRVFLNSNNLTETGFADEPIFWRKSAQLTVYCRFLFKEMGICTISSENHKEVEQIIFLNIRVLLNANNRTETDVSDKPLFSRKSSQLAVYRTFLFKEIVHLHPFITKSQRGRANHFHGY